MDALIQWKQVGFSYEPGKPVLKQVDLTIKKGEKIVVIGSNGVGKSTFFLLLNGILRPTAGDYQYKGETIRYKKRQLRTLRKEIGIVFQEPDQQIVAQTVFHEISFGLFHLGLTAEEIEKRTLRIMKRLKIDHLKDQPPHYLSGGQKKTVTIADILVMEPEILLFDEPTASLDPVSASNVEQILHEIAAEGKTLLISSHDMEFASRFADRILVFADGRILGDGKPKEIFTNKELMAQAGITPPPVYELTAVLKEKGILKSDLQLTDIKELIQSLQE